MKKIIIPLLFILLMSFSSFAKNGIPKKKILEPCESGLLTEGNKVVGYWMTCGNITWIRMVHSE